VTPEASLHLTKARQSLAKARAMLAIELAEKLGEQPISLRFTPRRLSYLTERGGHPKHIRAYALSSVLGRACKRVLRSRCGGS
jgi:hypothetical protein